MKATQEKNEVISCACGCNYIFHRFDEKGRERKYLSGHNSRIDNPHKKEKKEQICETCGSIYYRVPSLANRGKCNYCSNKCRSENTVAWFGGEKNPNWKGGFNGVQNIRWCPEYREWRKSVFERDLFLCGKCGGKHTRLNPIHAHHLIRFSESIELRFDVDNGITLCKKCHIEEHKKDWMGTVASKETPQEKVE